LEPLAVRLGLVIVDRLDLNHNAVLAVGKRRLIDAVLVGRAAGARE
jgi:hypothetical protein